MSKPGTFKFYQDLLEKKLTEGGQTLENLDNQRLNQAAAEVERQIDAMGPDPENLDQSFNEFCNRQSEPEAFRSMRADSTTIGQQGESRYDYAKRCRQEVMKGIKRQMRRSMEWNNAIKRIGLVDKDGNAKKIGTRWMFCLMKLDGKPESQHYNESIAALGALGNGLISQEKYLGLRKSYYTQHGGKTPEEAETEAKKDLANAAQYLYNEVSQRIEAHRPDFARGREAALAILSNDYSKFEGGMSEAFGIYYNDSVMLAFVGADILPFLSKQFNLQMTQEAQDEKIGEWQLATQPINGLNLVAELAANPYFALFDPAKYSESTVGPSIPNVQEPTKDDLAYAFMAGGDSYELEQTKELNAVLRNYALLPADEIKEERTQNFRVYHKDDRTVILKVGPQTAGSFLSLDDTRPGEYADVKGLHTHADRLLGRCAGWSTERRTSREFENMRQQLQQVRDLKFNTELTKEDMTKAAEAIEELRAYTQAYLKRKEVHHRGGEYENSRIAFAQEVLKFAKERQLRIGRWAEHDRTGWRRRVAEVEAGPNPEWKNSPVYADYSPLEYKVSRQREAAKAAKDAEREREHQLAEEAERPMREARRAMQLADGARCARQFDPLLAGCVGDVLPYKDAASQTENFISGEIARYRELVNHRKELLQQKKTALLFPDEASRQEAAKAAQDAAQAEQEAFQTAKSIAAGYIIAEMLMKENLNQQELLRRGGNANEVDTPFRKIVSGGKTEKLAEIISSSARFIEQFGERLSEPQAMEELIRERDAAAKNTRISSFRAGVEFLENMNLARQEQRDMEAQVRGNENVIRPAEDMKDEAHGKITMEGLNKAIEERLNDLTAGDLQKKGQEALALSTMKFMLMLTPDVANVGRDALMEQVLRSEDFQKEAGNVDLTKPEELKRVLDNSFGKNAAHVILEKAAVPPALNNPGTGSVVKGPNAITVQSNPSTGMVKAVPKT